MANYPKLVIGIDVDGTLTNLNEFYIQQVAKMIKRSPIHTDAYSFKDIFELNKKQELYLGFRVLEKYCKTCPIRKNAKEVLAYLKQSEYELHIISARKYVSSNNIIGFHYRKLLMKWFKKNALTFDSIQYCSEDFSPRDKLLGCRKLHVDIMIEDKTDVAMHLAENGITVILIDAPYNQEAQHYNIIRVSNWLEVKEVIQSLSSSNKNTNECFKNTQEQEILKKYISLKSHINRLNHKDIRKGKRNYNIIYRLLYPLMKIKYNPVIENKKSIPYQNGIIICSNHLYSSDSYLIDLAIGSGHYYAGFAASEIKNTFRGKIFNLTKGAVFIDRKNQESKKSASEELAIRIISGDNALIFPEGTRKNKTAEGKKKTILPFHKGAVSIAQKTGTAILPIAIHYGKRNRVKLGELFYVLPTDDVPEKTNQLQNYIETMILDLKKLDNSIPTEKEKRNG